MLPQKLRTGIPLRTMRIAVRRGTQRRITPIRLLTAAAVAALIYLLIVPLSVTFYSSFRGPSDSLPFESGGFFHLGNFNDLAISGVLVSTFVGTAEFVGGSVAVGLLIGVALAWLIERTDFPGRNVLFMASIAPLAIPPIILAQAWVVMVSPSTGLLNVLIRTLIPIFETGPINGFSLYGMIFVQGILFVPFFTVLLTAVFRNMDASLEEASWASGGSAIQTIRRITIPLVMPGVASIALLGGIIILGVFEVPLLFGVGAGVDVVSLRMWLLLQPTDTVIPRYGELSALGVVFLLLIYGLFFLYAWMVKSAAKYATITGKGYRPRRSALGALKWPIFALVATYFMIVVAMPMFTLVWSSLFRFYTPPTLESIAQVDFSAYPVVLGGGEFYRAAGRTVVVAVTAATLSVTLAVIIAWTVVRSPKSVATRALDLFATSSVAIPATVAGYAFLVFYLNLSRVIPIYGTMWILVLAYAFRTSVAYRISQAGIIQISKELEDASAASGATPLGTLKHILLPLLAPNILVAWLLLFFLATHEFTIAMFLVNPDTVTLPVLIFSKLGSVGGGGAFHADEAGVMGVAFAIGSLALALLFRVTLTRRIRREP